jgi:hypothetical protein
MITDHAFWELQGGTSALFWSDSWQQLPSLDKDPNLRTFIPFTTGAGLQKVVDFWIPEDNRDTWRNWKKTHEELHIPLEINIQPLLDQLNSRRIFSQQGEDILRWGHSNTGTYNLQEAYFFSTGHNSLPKEAIWNKIWGAKLWPKINTFLWLAANHSILTWDNLMKRGFIGPSWCHLCCNDGETQNHLLNLCSYNSHLWDQCASIMRTSDRNRLGIRETMEEWRDSIFQSPILNRIWQLLPGFILWQIWKE